MERVGEEDEYGVIKRVDDETLEYVYGTARWSRAMPHPRRARIAVPWASLTLPESA